MCKCLHVPGRAETRCLSLMFSFGRTEGDGHAKEHAEVAKLREELTVERQVSLP